MFEIRDGLLVLLDPLLNSMASCIKSPRTQLDIGEGRFFMILLSSSLRILAQKIYTETQCHKKWGDLLRVYETKKLRSSKSGASPVT